MPDRTKPNKQISYVLYRANSEKQRFLLYKDHFSVQFNRYGILLLLK